MVICQLFLLLEVGNPELLSQGESVCIGRKGPEKCCWPFKEKKFQHKNTLHTCQQHHFFVHISIHLVMFIQVQAKSGDAHFFYVGIVAQLLIWPYSYIPWEVVVGNHWNWHPSPLHTWKPWWTLHTTPSFFNIMCTVVVMWVAASTQVLLIPDSKMSSEQKKLRLEHRCFASPTPDSEPSCLF